MPEPTVKVKVTADTSGYQKGLKDAEKATVVFEDSMGRLRDERGRFVKGAGESAKSVKLFGKDVQVAGGQVGKFGNSVAGFAMGAGMAFFNVVKKSVGAMTQFVKGGILYAAQVEQMEGTLAILGRQQGISSEAMNQATKDIRDVGIQTGAAQQILAQFTRMGLEVDDAVRMSAEARDLATVSGADTTATAMRILHGVQTKQTDVLRMAGVNIGDLNIAYREYAASIDTTASALTEEQKIRAVMNAVSKEAAKVQGAAEEADKNAIKRLGSLSRVIKDISLEMGKPFVAAFSAGVYAVKEFTDYILTAVQEGGQLRPLLDKIGSIITELSDDFEKGIDKAVKKLPEMIEQLNATADSAVQFGGIMAGVVATLGDAFTALAWPIKSIGKGIAGTFDVIIKGSIAAVSAIKATGAALMGNVDDAVFYAQVTEEALNQAFASIGDTLTEIWIDDLGEAGDAARNAITGVSFAMGQTEFVERFTGDIEDAANALDDLTEAAAIAQGRMNQLETELLPVLKKSIADQLRAKWAALDEEKRIAAQRAQIQAQYGAAMQKASASYRQGQAQAAVSHGKTMLNIQREYEKAKDDIMRQWEMSRDEAIRSRDAIALVRAENQRDEALAEAGASRDEQKGEAGVQYQEQLQSLKTALEEQQQAALDARNQQSAALAEQIAQEAAEKALAAERERMLQEVNQAASLASLQQFLNAELRAQYDTQIAEYTAAAAHYARMNQLRAQYMRPGGASGYTAGSGGIQQYQQGTDYVPQTGLAYLHQGEAVIPARENRRGGGASHPVVDQSGWTFNGPISEEDKQWFRDEAQELAINTYAEIARD